MPATAIRFLTGLKEFQGNLSTLVAFRPRYFCAATVMQRTIQNPVITRQFEKGKMIVQNEIEVNSDSLQIDFYDNGEVDGDSISVFFNEKLLGPI
jgi:hypothetical protein